MVANLLAGVSRDHSDSPKFSATLNLPLLEQINVTKDLSLTSLIPSSGKENWTYFHLHITHNLVDVSTMNHL